MCSQRRLISCEKPSSVSSVRLIAVGDELLNGSVNESHAYWLGGELPRFATHLSGVVIVPDDQDEIGTALRRTVASPDCGAVIVTGGLGPTSDDLTREALAAAFDAPLEHRDEAWADIRAQFPGIGGQANMQQARVPAGWQLLGNEWGTAPGLLGVIGTVAVAALPGPPREFQKMCARHLPAILKAGRVASEEVPSASFTTFGVPESRLEERLRDASDGSLRWHTRAEQMRIVVRVDGSIDGGAQAALLRDRVAATEGAVRVAPGETSLAACTVSELSECSLTFAAAESCTGGMIGTRITDVSGSSAVFWGSLVTYSNEAKTRLLDVPATLIEKHGAVSEECVLAMANGARTISGSDLAVAVSGVAGPGGGTQAKPVGTVWLAISGESGGSAARRIHVNGDRDRVRRVATVEALLMLRERVSQCCASA